MSNMNSLFEQVDARKGKSPIARPPQEAPAAAPAEPVQPIAFDPGPAPADTPKDPTPTSDNWEKRYKDLQSFKDTQVSEYQEKIKTLEETSRVPVVLPKTAEEIEKFKGDNKDLYDSIQTMIKMDLTESDKEFTSKLEQLDTQHQKLTSNQKNLDLLEKHADAKAVKNSEEFKSWFGLQSTGIKNLFGNTASVDDWASGLDIYKRTVGKQTSVAAAAESVLNNSQGQTTVEKTVYKESEIIAHSQDKEWWVNNRHKVNEARLDGRLIMDVSKKQ